MLIHKLPKVLILHMKRFIIDPFEVTKNSTYMSFPLILDVAPYCDASCLEVLLCGITVEWYPKNISAVKKARTRKWKLLNDLKM